MTRTKIIVALGAFAALTSTAHAEYGLGKPGVTTETTKSGVIKTTTASAVGPFCKVPVDRHVHGQKLIERNVETKWQTRGGLQVKRRRSFWNHPGQEQSTQLSYTVENPLPAQKGLYIDVVGGNTSRPVYQWIRQTTKPLFVKVEPEQPRQFNHAGGARQLSLQGRVRDVYAALLKNKGFSDQEIVERAFTLPEGDIHVLLDEWAAVHGFAKEGKGESVSFSGGRELAGAFELKSSCCGKESVKDYVHVDKPREERYVGSFGRGANGFQGFTMVTHTNHAHNSELFRLAAELL